MHGLVLRYRNRVAVPLNHDLLPLLLAQQLVPADALVRISHNCLEQPPVVPEQTHHRGPVEKIGAVLEAAVAV